MRTPRLFIFVMVIIMTSTASPAIAEHEYDVIRPLLGGVAGGVLGSVLGSTIGNDKGKKIGAGVGAALGLLAGHAVARREHAKQMPRNVSVPHALRVPTLRIQQPTMALNCKILDRVERIYACRDQSGRWTTLSARSVPKGRGYEPKRTPQHVERCLGHQSVSGCRGHSPDRDVLALRPNP